jgi:hypothetical protein
MTCRIQLVLSLRHWRIGAQLYQISGLSLRPDLRRGLFSVHVRSKGHPVYCMQSRVLLAAVPLVALDMHEVICHHHQNPGG